MSIKFAVEIFLRNFSNFKHISNEALNRACILKPHSRLYLRFSLCVYMRLCLLLSIRYNNFDMSERKTPKELEGLKQEIKEDEQHLKELLEGIVSLRKTLKEKYKELRKLYPPIEEKQKKYWEEYVRYYERKKADIPMKRNFYDGIIQHLRQKRIEDEEIKELLCILSQESEEE